MSFGSTAAAVNAVFATGQTPRSRARPAPPSVRKRRRAHDLINKIKQDLDNSTTVKLITDDGPHDLSELNPDQLLDLPKPDDPHA